MPAGVSAYVPLANITLSSNASTVTFSSISQSYRDLVFVLRQTTTGTAFSRFRINGDGAGNYSYVTMESAGGNALSNQASGANEIPLPTGSSSDSFSWWLNRIYFLDYSTSFKGQTGFMRTDNPEDRVAAVSFRWGVSSALSQVQFIGNNQPFAAGSTFALYGVTS